MGRLDGRIAIVTGAGRGIGKAIAEELAREGADLALCGRQVEPLNETAVAVQALGRRALVVSTDVGNAEAVDAFVAQVAAHFGRIDILVNNAGVTRDKLLIRMTDEDWDEVMRSSSSTSSCFGTLWAGERIETQRSLGPLSGGLWDFRLCRRADFGATLSP